MFRARRAISAVLIAACLGIAAVRWLGHGESVCAQVGPASAVRSAPKVTNVFPTLDVPYDGLGSVWIGPDGLVMIETGDHDGLTFKFKATGLALVERDAIVSFAKNNNLETAIHRFGVVNSEEAAKISIVYDIPGYMALDYDEATGDLEVRVEGAKQSFHARFNLKNATALQSPNGRADGTAQEAADGTSCQCRYDGPPGGNCSASKTCPVGYDCRCRCDKLGSTCSSCSRVRFDAVDVLTEEQLE